MNLRRVSLANMLLIALMSGTLLLAGGATSVWAAGAPEKAEKHDAHASDHDHAHHDEKGHDHDTHTDDHGDGHDKHGDEHHDDAHGKGHNGGHHGPLAALVERHHHYEGKVKNKIVKKYMEKVHHVIVPHKPHEIASVFTLTKQIFHTGYDILKITTIAEFYKKKAIEQRDEEALRFINEDMLVLEPAKYHETGLFDKIAYLQYKWSYGIIAFLIVCFYMAFGVKIYNSASMIPDRWSAFGELVVKGFYDFLSTILGPEDARRYLPFLGTLFLFIFANNFMSITIFMKSPSAIFFNNLGVGLCVFFYCQYIAVTRQGPIHYLLHLMGEPKDIVGWLLSPLFLVLETLGELVRPISLSLRLFGNILGEDILLFVFCGIGIGLVVGIPGLSWMPIGLPIHLALAPLILMFSTIQALVFTLLSAVYISLKVPHGDHHDEAHAH